MVFENERATTVIEGPGLEVAVVQIASRLVRQIAGYVGVGDKVAQGQRIGVIRLGSQVDVVLPSRSDLQVTVRPGQRVRAGESVLALVEPFRRGDGNRNLGNRPSPARAPAGAEHPIALRDPSWRSGGLPRNRWSSAWSAIGEPGWLRAADWRLFARIADPGGRAGDELVESFTCESGQAALSSRAADGRVRVPFGFADAYAGYTAELWAGSGGQRRLHPGVSTPSTG